MRNIVPTKHQVANCIYYRYSNKFLLQYLKRIESRPTVSHCIDNESIEAF